MTREEAKRRIECCRNFLANNYSDMGEPNFTAFKMAIEALSAEPKTGHWQNNACSNCGIYNASAYKNWCPNCGAKMLEPQERSDKE